MSSISLGQNRDISKVFLNRRKSLQHKDLDAAACRRRPKPLLHKELGRFAATQQKGESTNHRNQFREGKDDNL